MIEKLEEFDFKKGRSLAARYTVMEKLGAGWEGEVYKVQELHTGICRAAKFFYPHRNQKLKVSTRYAKKLNKLAFCPIVMNYHTHEILTIRGHKVACLISELIEGEILSTFIKRHRGGRIGVFQGLHLLYALALGVESIHLNGEYHGDLHLDNIIIKRAGLGFDLKVIDMHHWGDSKKDNRDEDIIKMINLFFECLGGQKTYKNHPQEIKDIIKGLKRGLILKEYKTVSHLRVHLETLNWRPNGK
jgi:serine/threonine protein kinase